jgi:hypothetical protein
MPTLINTNLKQKERKESEYHQEQSVFAQVQEERNIPVNVQPQEVPVNHPSGFNKCPVHNEDFILLCLKD